MSPFPTDGNFTNQLAKIVYEVVAAETEVVRKRNEISPDFYSFLTQGTEEIYLVHLPMFHVANHRQQLIVHADFDEKSKKKYISMKKAYPTEPMILVSQHKTMMRDIIEKHGSFKAQIMTKSSGIILQNVAVFLKKTIVSRPLNSKWRLKDYPRTFMPFYLYGTPNEANIDHVIVRAPNTHLSAGRCRLKLYRDVDAGIWDKHLVLLIENVREAPMQPLPPNSEIGSKNGAIIAHENLLHEHHTSKIPLLKDNSAKTNSNGNNNSDGEVHEDDKSEEPHVSATVVNSETRSGTMRGSSFFFRPGAIFKVSVWEDKDRSHESSKFASFELGKFVGRGILTLSESVYVDSEAMNFDPFKRKEKVTEWRHEFDQIGKELD
ncbi:hypothetical protein F5B20DRAFT_580451 [Whalleya microplaca]|nr:hypothetical protein F5B20DRAFT_580451 [Whalleya microplaca]